MRVLLVALLAGCAHTVPIGALHTERAEPHHAQPIPALFSAAPRVHHSVASRSRPLTSTLTDTTCYTATGSRTASGSWPQPGDAASNTHRFGTVLLVEHHGQVVVRDRIGSGTSLDLFMTSADCARFGRQQLHVTVLP